MRSDRTAGRRQSIPVYTNGIPWLRGRDWSKFSPHHRSDVPGISYNSNTILLINLSVIFFIASFITLVYHDAKFFYLANLIKHGKKLRKEKKYQSALRYCNKSIRIYPNFATAWNNKGNILFNMGKKTDAVKCYKKALSLNPDYLPAKENLKLAQRQ